MSSAVSVGDVSVELISYGDRKINTIKIVRDHANGIGLKDAKDFVEATKFYGPSIVRGLTRGDAEQFVMDLEEGGATAQVCTSSEHSN